MNREQFSAQLADKGIRLTKNQLKQFDLYFKTLVEWNEKMNLTALTSEGDVYLKHFYDSISVAFYFDFTKPLKLCDVGAGAGFPSIPLKICFPHLRVTIVDSLKKRIGFLEHLAKELGLEHVNFYHDRAETFGRNKKFRQRFDIVIARAVARMSVLSELCLPLVKKNGTFIAMKGSQVEEELSVGQKAIQRLGGHLKHTYTFTLPEENSERSIVIIDKKENTPKKYPRKPGIPNRQPIE
ncbi:MAG TPA: 16S rRNA (guanine(527)-N(7))-methyltransferase RsmG [Bacillota bacterium]